jgi:hypothetical protein
LQSAVTHKRQHYAARCNAAGKLFAVCAFEVSGGIYLSEMKSVLKRIHRGISERSAISYKRFIKFGVVKENRLFLTN